MISEDKKTHHRTLPDYFWITVRGFCMGAADVVPGVSGGTMAFILGIYNELLDAVHAINLDFIRRVLTLKWRVAFAMIPWRFLLALGIGILLAIFTLAEGLSWALHHHPDLVWAFFFGLVLASILLVRKRVKRWSLPLALIMIAAAVFTFWLVGAAPVQTPDTPLFLFFSGFMAICAMILPGISGAYILVLLGKYQYVLDAVVQLDVLTLAIVAAGCVTGLLSFVRLLRWLLMRYHDLTIATLMGIMIGSLRKVWPWKTTPLDTMGSAGEGAPIHELLTLPAAFTIEVALAIGLALLGASVILAMDYMVNRKAKQRVAPQPADGNAITNRKITNGSSD